MNQPFPSLINHLLFPLDCALFASNIFRYRQNRSSELRISDCSSPYCALFYKGDNWQWLRTMMSTVWDLKPKPRLMKQTPRNSIKCTPNPRIWFTFRGRRLSLVAYLRSEMILSLLHLYFRQIGAFCIEYNMRRQSIVPHNFTLWNTFTPLKLPWLDGIRSRIPNVLYFLTWFSISIISSPVKAMNDILRPSNACNRYECNCNDICFILIITKARIALHRYPQYPLLIRLTSSAFIISKSSSSLLWSHMYCT